MTCAIAHPDTDDVSDPSERRSAARIPLETEISLASDSQFFTALGGNLSSGGVFVATYRELPVGATVEVRIALPDGDVVAKGTVRWVRDMKSGAAPGLGIAFDAVDAEAAERIARFCTARPPLLHDDAWAAQ